MKRIWQKRDGGNLRRSNQITYCHSMPMRTQTMNEIWLLEEILKHKKPVSYSFKKRHLRTFAETEIVMSTYAGMRAALNRVTADEVVFDVKPGRLVVLLDALMDHRAKRRLIEEKVDTLLSSPFLEN